MKGKKKNNLKTVEKRERERERGSKMRLLDKGKDEREWHKLKSELGKEKEVNGEKYRFKFGRQTITEFE